MNPLPRYLILSALAIAPAAFLSAQDTQTDWTALPAFDSRTTPAVSAHFDQRLYTAAIAHNGLVAVTSTDTPGGWTPWQIMGPQPCAPQPCFDTAFYADRDTPPVLIQNGAVLYLFARGRDNNLYVIRKNGAGNWDPNWLALTSDGQVGGRVSVAFRKLIGSANTELHVIYATGFNSVEYRQYVLNGLNLTPLAGRHQWCNAIEGVLASDGDTRLCAVLRAPTELWMESKTGAWPWKHEVTRIITSGTDQVLELSSLVYYANAFHVAYTYPSGPAPRGGTAYTVAHARFRPGQFDDQYVRFIYTSTLDTGLHPLPELAVYRNKLICAWADEVGNVRYSRWDMANPQGPWAGNVVLDAARKTAHRPALGAFNRLPLPNNAQYAQPNFGNDLFAAINETTTSGIWAMNLSRSALVHYLDRQVAVYNYAFSGGCTNQGEPNAPVLVNNLFTDGRPVLTELGMSMWMLPEWLAGHVFKDAGEQGCINGNPSGRFPSPCATTKYPVIIKPNGGIYICSGVWVNQADNYLRIWEEYGHALGGIVGFGDRSQQHPNGVPPTQFNADLTGIPLANLLAGFNLFAEQCTHGTAPNGRCRGFVDICCPANYDAGTIQHSYMYVIYRYIQDGDLLRRMVRDDLAAGVDLLQRKYDWVRQNIYRGMEFRRDGDPLLIWNDDCANATWITDGFYRGTTETATNDGSSNWGSSSSSPDVWYAYTAECSGTLSLNTCGSPFDTVLSVHSGCPGTTANELAGNDDCTNPCNGTNSCLSLSVTNGQTYWIRVSGYNGARGDFVLGVANNCTLIPLGGSSPDRFDDQTPAGEIRNDTFAQSAVISQPVQESLLLQTLSIDDVNFDRSDDVDFFTVQIPTPEAECCLGQPGPGSIQGQLRFYVHPEVLRPFEITFYQTNGTAVLTTNALSVYLDCPRELFPDGRVTFSLRDPGCRNDYSVSLGYHRCDQRIYPPWYLEYDPPLFKYLIPERPEQLHLQFPMDPDVLNGFVLGSVTPPFPAEFLRMDRTESGPFVLDILLPAGGDLRVQLLNEAGAVIGEAEEQSGVPAAAGDALPNSRRFNLTLPVLPPGLYFLKVEGLEIGVEYILNAPPCLPPPEGLVAWWSADDDFTDRVSSLDGEPEGIVGFAPGLAGSAFGFEGGGSVRVDSRPELQPPAFTIAAWINPFSYEGNRVLEKGGWRVGGGYGFEFNAFGTEGIRFVVWTEIPQVIDSDFTVPLGVWTHIAGTFDGGEMRLYVNGIEQSGSRPADMIGNEAPLTIGRASAAEDLYFLGLIDEVQLYDRALERPEIAALYEAGSAGVCRNCPPGPPRLTIQRDGNLVEIAWPGCPGWELEETVLLDGTNQWRRLPPPYRSDTLRYRVTLQNPTANRFYRLHKP